MYVKYMKDKLTADITNETNIKLDGEDAVKLHLVGTGSDADLKLIHIYTMHKDEPYFIRYNGFGDKFNNKLPEFEQMLTSFKWEE